MPGDTSRYGVQEESPPDREPRDFGSGARSRLNEKEMVLYVSEQIRTRQASSTEDSQVSEAGLKRGRTPDGGSARKLLDTEHGRYVC